MVHESMGINLTLVEGNMYSTQVVLSLPFGQPALQFYLPDAILTYSSTKFSQQSNKPTTLPPDYRAQFL